MCVPVATLFFYQLFLFLLFCPQKNLLTVAPDHRSDQTRFKFTSIGTAGTEHFYQSLQQAGEISFAEKRTI